jgi:hypothetical protein
MASYSWGQIRLLLQKFAGPQISLDQIDHAINARYELILSLMNWHAIEASAVLRTTAAYSAGAITLTTGSTAVTGVGTAWTSAMSGRQLFLGNGPVYTVTILSATSLTLDRPFEGTAYGAYWLAQTLYQLPDDCRNLRSISSPVDGANLDAIDEDVFGELEGSFLAVNEPAGSYVPQPDGVDGQTGATVQQILLYPVPTLAQGYPIKYDAVAEAFDGSSTTDAPLAAVSSSALIAGAKADLELEKPNGSLAKAAAYEAMYAAFFRAMIHLENDKRPGQRMMLEQSYWQHRIDRFLRSGGPVIARNVLLDSSDDDLLTGAGTFRSETPAGAVNGVNGLFTLSYPALTPVIVTVNGALKLAGTNYTASGMLIVFLPGSIPAGGAAILAQYTY